MWKTFTVWVFVSLITTLSYAQNNSFEWGFHLGGSAQETLTSKILLDSDQNIIIALNKNSTIFDVDPSGNVKNLKSKYFIAKYTPEKELVWVKEWGTKFEMDGDFKIAIDDRDDIYLTGNFVGEFDADPSENKYILKNES